MKMTDHKGRPQVAVTGLGIVTSLGKGKSDNWAALTSGKSGIHSITRFPLDHLSTTIAGTVDFLEASDKGAGALTFQLADLAAEEAIEQAGLDGRIDAPLFLASPPSRSTGTHASRSTRPVSKAKAATACLTPRAGPRTMICSRPLNSARSPNSSPANTACAACRSPCRPPALPAPPRSSSPPRPSVAANASARWPSGLTARPPPRH